MSILSPVAATLAAVSLISFSAIAAQEVQRPDPASRWLVTLRDRSFDLGTYEAARAGDVDAGAMAAVVADLARRARADQAAIATAVADLGGRVLDHWWIVNGLAVEVTAAGAEALRAHPRVLAIHADQLRRAGIKTSTNAANHATDVAQALGIRGAGVTVAIVDSGVDSNMAGLGRPHATFYPGGDPNNRTGPGLQGSRLLANVAVGAMSADDIIAHGTAVAGVAAGSRWNATSVADDGHAPEATIVSYGVADDANGGTWASTLVRAWQQVAADAQRYNIKVACCSYEGIFDLSFLDQQALDETARIADVLITGMAGNGGSTGVVFGYGATNMLAVGACEHDTLRVAAFSQRGPVSWGTITIRTSYPDLIANGVGVTMPLADDETRSKWAQGTSYSAPQVAGAAALYRSLRVRASADETRAAILATSLDVIARQAPPDQNRNAVGHGYLKADALVHAAMQAPLSLTSTVDAQHTTRTFLFRVDALRSYGVAIAWMRARYALPTASELDLDVTVDGVTLTSATQGNHDELVRFVAQRAGTAVVTVRSSSIVGPSQSFALVAAEIPSQVVGGGFAVFGQACHQNILTITSTTAPIPGGRYALDCAPTWAFSPSSWMMLGASRSSHLGIALPFDLTPLGAPRCQLSISPQLYVPIPVNTSTGVTRMAFPLPVDSGLVGAHIYHQVLAVSPTLNPLGAVTSNAVEVTVAGLR